MTRITEIPPDLFRITMFVKPFDLQFSQFLVHDEDPLLFRPGIASVVSRGQGGGRVAH